MDTETLHRRDVPPQRLWFGFAASAVAWVSLGICDIIITWRSCLDRDQSGMPSAHPVARLACIVISFVLIGTVLAAGIASYRNLRALSGSSSVLGTLATDRREFMAVLGVLVSITLGMGVLWLTVPPFVLQFCARVR